MMLRSTVRHASRTWLWNTMPMLSAGPSTTLPAISIEPRVAGSRPRNQFQERALAAAARTDDGEELAFAQVEVQRLQRLDDAVGGGDRLSPRRARE